MTIHRKHLLAKMLCHECEAAWAKRKGCQRCGGTGLVDFVPDTTGAGYMGGAWGLAEFMNRLMDLLEQSTKDETALMDAGNLDGAIVEAARRSGIAEVGIALGLWITAQSRRRETG